MFVFFVDSCVPGTGLSFCNNVREFFLYVTLTPWSFISFIHHIRGTDIGTTHISCNSLLWQPLNLYFSRVLQSSHVTIICPWN